MKATPENIAQLIRELEELPIGADNIPPAPPALPPERGDDNGGDMERRVTKLEDKVDKLIDRATAVEVSIATLSERIAHLPSKDFIVKVVVGSLSVFGALSLFGSQIKAALGIN